MAYDLLIQNGRIVDGSGMPSFIGDVGVRQGKIADIGKLSGQAARTIDAAGLVVAPGFIDNHCHYDAQVLWDPLCSSSCYHGATTVIFGNCSLSLAPVKPGDHARVASMLSYVEAIPMDVLQAGVPWTWVDFPAYMQTVEQRLGVNVGMLIGHSPVRYYAMGEAGVEDGRPATDKELAIMQAQVRAALEAGALGLSLTRERHHFDLDGRLVPGACAPEGELFALADVLRQVGAGIIQCGGATSAELDHRLMSRLSNTSGRPVLYNALLQSVRTPGLWQEHLAFVEAACKAGTRAWPMATPNPIRQRFTMRNCQLFRGMPSWHPILIAPDHDKLRAYADPAVRERLRADLAAPPGPNPVFSRRWDLVVVEEPRLPGNQDLRGKSLARIAAEQSKDVLDVFLDLAVEEDLDTVFLASEINIEAEAVAAMLNSPYTVIGLSDGGAHVQFDSGACYTTRLLGEWVRERQIMSLEEAVRKLTFVPASAFELHDRGLLRPGLAADLTIFDADTVQPLPQEIAHDFPNDGWRIVERAQGIAYTVVNGTVLMEHGKHTGALPGRVLRNPVAARKS